MMLYKHTTRCFITFLFVMISAGLLNISFIYEISIHNHLQWIKDASVQFLSENQVPEELEAFPSTIRVKHLEKLSIICNCSTMRIPKEWLSDNVTLEQLGHRIELKDCTRSYDIGQLFETRRQILNSECKSLGPEDIDLYRNKWTWQSAGGINNTLYLDDRKNYQICIVPKSGSSSWKSYSKYIRKVHLQTKQEVHILPVRHPFTRLVSVYNDKFCMGKLFTCHYYKRHNNKFSVSDVVLYGQWIPLLISSGRIETNNDFSKALKNTIPLKGEGKGDGANSELVKIVRNSFLNNTNEILEKFKGIVIPFKDFINHIFWTYEHSVADHHWNPQTSLCDVCRVSWSFVLHLENNKEESMYMLEKLGFNNSRMVYEKNVSKKKGTPDYANFFFNIPTSMIIKLVKYYYYDFVLLGYSL